MRSKSMMLILVSLGFGAVAAVGMVQVISRSTQVVEEDKVPVLVALEDLDIKDELTVDNVQVRMFPVSLVPEGIVGSWEEAEGKKTLSRIGKDMMIMQNMIIEKNKVTDVSIPPGYDRLAINVDARDSFFGLLKPGDRVHVIAIRSDGEKETAKTFLKNVLVYAVDDKTDLIEDEKGEPRTASTVTLVVNQRQAEAIALCDSNGNLRLVMAGQSDSNEPELVEDSVISPPKRETVEQPSGVASLIGAAAGWLQSMQENAPAAPASVAAPTRPVASGSRANHTMTVMMTNGAAVNYEWQDRSQLPTLRPIVPAGATGTDGIPASVGGPDQGGNAPAPGSSFDYVDDGAE